MPTTTSIYFLKKIRTDTTDQNAYWSLLRIRQGYVGFSQFQFFKISRIPKHILDYKHEGGWYKLVSRIPKHILWQNTNWQ